MNQLSLKRFVSLASAFYLSAGLPWCLLTFLGFFSGHSASAVGIYTALWFWGVIGLFAGYVAFSPSRSEARSVARCIVAGYLVNFLAVPVALGLAYEGAC